ncbi:hypothetical protein ACLK19_19465 [Escherichia coli]
MGGTQSLHTNAFDEALGLPADFWRAHCPQHPKSSSGRIRTLPHRESTGDPIAFELADQSNRQNKPELLSNGSTKPVASQKQWERVSQKRIMEEASARDIR